MKIFKYLLLVLFLTIKCSIVFSQEKDYLKEIIELKITTNKLVLDTTKLKLKIRSLKRTYSYETNHKQWVIDSLRWVIKKMNIELDSFRSQEKKIFELASNASIIYQRDNNESEIYYILLNSYNIKLKGDIIKLIPIKDELKWKKIRIYGLPEQDNLSLHFYPHTLYGSKFKKVKNGF